MLIIRYIVWSLHIIKLEPSEDREMGVFPREVSYMSVGPERTVSCLSGPSQAEVHASWTMHHESSSRKCYRLFSFPEEHKITWRRTGSWEGKSMGFCSLNFFLSWPSRTTIHWYFELQGGTLLNSHLKSHLFSSIMYLPVAIYGNNPSIHENTCLPRMASCPLITTKIEPEYIWLKSMNYPSTFY